MTKYLWMSSAAVVISALRVNTCLQQDLENRKLTDHTDSVFEPQTSLKGKTYSSARTTEPSAFTVIQAKSYMHAENNPEQA